MPLSIVLVQPEIPGNTGAVGRTCVALDAELPGEGPEDLSGPDDDDPLPE